MVTALKPLLEMHGFYQEDKNKKDLMGRFKCKDFEVFYNLTLDANAMAACKLNPQCGLTNSCSGNCPISSTFQTASTYSKSCSTFMTDFKSVITLMLANGYSNLETTQCTC